MFLGSCLARIGVFDEEDGHGHRGLYRISAALLVGRDEAAVGY